MDWIEVSVTAHLEAVEPLSELLSDITGNGIAIEEPYQLSDDGQSHSPRSDAPVVVHAYLPDDEHSENRLQRITTALGHLRLIGTEYVGEMQVRHLAEDDWAEAWKAYFTVTPIGQRIVIKPTWRDYEPATTDKAIIEIDPGMAFGTGTHPTTRLCLEALEEVVHGGETVLDVGTGSGILAIGALKLGADRAIGCDISTVAVRVARENVALNGLGDRIQVRQGTLEMGPDGEVLLIPAPPEPGEDLNDALTQIERIEQSDIVIANIIAHIISAIAPQLVNAVRPGGTLVASGIIADRLDMALFPLQQAGLMDIIQRRDGDWYVLIGRRQV